MDDQIAVLEQKVDALLTAYQQLLVENDRLRQQLAGQEEARLQLLESRRVMDSHLRTLLEEKKQLESARVQAAERLRRLIGRLELGAPGADFSEPEVHRLEAPPAGETVHLHPGRIF